MQHILIFLFFYTLIISSILGYGFATIKCLGPNIAKKEEHVGLYGLFIVILLSYFTSLFFNHGIYHNLIFIFFGIFLFFKFHFKIRYKIFTYLFLFLFLFLFIFKNHDDFSYYHFPYIFYLVEFKTQLGIGNFNHGFRTPSSIFYLNSLFYLPLINDKGFNFGALIISGFSSYYFLIKLFNQFKSKKINFFTFYSVFSLGFINIFFYRIAEHGTDRSAQILVLILVYEILKFLNLKKNLIKINFEIKNLIFPIYLISLIISFKAFFVLYCIFFIPILIKVKKYLNIKNLKILLFHISICSILVSFVFLSYLFNTGCVVYPVSFTCISDLSWSISNDEVSRMNEWYQLWSKAGAAPDYRVENREIYIQNFNWLNNWIDKYFFNKVSDFIIGILFFILVNILTFLSATQNKLEKIKILNVILIIFILLLEWFLNHPALRYGGYVLIFLILIIPTCLFLTKYASNFKKMKNKITFILILILLISFARNINRISFEIKKYDYDPANLVFYKLDQQHLRISNKMKTLINEFENCEKNQCNEDPNYMVKKFFDRYIFINKSF